MPSRGGLPTAKCCPNRQMARDTGSCAGMGACAWACQWQRSRPACAAGEAHSQAAAGAGAEAAAGAEEAAGAAAAESHEPRQALNYDAISRQVARQPALTPAGTPRHCSPGSQSRRRHRTPAACRRAPAAVGQRGATPLSVMALLQWLRGLGGSSAATEGSSAGPAATKPALGRSSAARAITCWVRRPLAQLSGAASDHVLGAAPNSAQRLMLGSVAS